MKIDLGAFVQASISWALSRRGSTSMNKIDPIGTLLPPLPLLIPVERSCGTYLHEHSGAFHHTLAECAPRTWA